MTDVIERLAEFCSCSFEPVGKCCHCEAADLLRQAREALEPFARIADMDGRMHENDSTLVRVGLTREAARVHALLGGQKP